MLLRGKPAGEPTLREKKTKPSNLQGYLFSGLAAS
jgi:hypothetical protein